MKRKLGKVICRIREDLETIDSSLEDFPFAVVGRDSGARYSPVAKKLLRKLKLSEQELSGMLGVAANHIKSLTCSGLDIFMLRLLGDDVLVLFCDRQLKNKLPVAITSKEKAVLRLLCKAKCNKAIAKELGISPSTVNAHLDNIYRKLKVSSRVDAAIVALKHGLTVAE